MFYKQTQSCFSLELIVFKYYYFLLRVTYFGVASALLPIASPPRDNDNEACLLVGVT